VNRSVAERMKTPMQSIVAAKIAALHVATVIRNTPNMRIRNA